MTDEEWKEVSALRIFRDRDTLQARRRIDSLIIAFRSLELDRERIPEYRAKLTAFAKEVKNLDGLLSELAALGSERVFQPESKTKVVKHPHRALLDQESIHKIKAASRMPQRRLKSGISLLSNGSPGPSNEDVYYFVNELNDIVKDHSNGGSLTRSNKNWPNKGNDVAFVTSVLRIACKGTGRVIGSGTIIGALKQIRTIVREPSESMSFDLEIPEVDFPLEAGLAEIRRLRKRF